MVSSTSRLNLSLKMGPWWVLWVFPSVLSLASSRSVVFFRHQVSLSFFTALAAIIFI